MIAVRRKRWTEMPRGGHFAAMEESELLVEDIRAFFRGLRQETNMPNVNWPVVWQELQDNLAKQPRCPQHPDYPYVSTLVQQVTNDIVKVGTDGILVRSHRTSREDFIEVSRFEAWWNHLVTRGSASLYPGDQNNPHPWRSRLVGVIMAQCLPDKIRVIGSDTIRLIDC